MTALKEIRRIVTCNRILMKPSFQDFDKAKCCHITVQQFGRVLKKLNIIPSSQVVFDLIARKYFDKGNTKEINYFDFIKDVDRPEDMFVDASISNKAPKDISQSFNKSLYFAGPTDSINVMENRFSLQPVNIANNPSDVEQRL